MEEAIDELLSEEDREAMRRRRATIDKLYGEIERLEKLEELRKNVSKSQATRRRRGLRRSVSGRRSRRVVRS